MSFYILDDICIGCGACEYVCPTAAITRRESAQYRVTFIIDMMQCNDCNACPSSCPVDCIKQDPASIICHGRGCPLNEKSAMRDWECTELTDRRCAKCNNVLWRKPGEQQWFCFKCDASKGACPKVRAAQKPGYAVTPPLVAESEGQERSEDSIRRGG